MMFFGQFLQSFYGKGFFWSDVRIAVFHNGSVKIYSNSHNILF